MSEAERRARAEVRRQTAVLHRARLAPVEGDFDPVTGADAVSLSCKLSLESWSATGQPLPTYTRAQIPIRFVPRGGA
ncbi:MAG TPA: hypothetical protein VF316_15915 [Polyangiaceae bacterium]